MVPASDERSGHLVEMTQLFGALTDHAIYQPVTLCIPWRSDEIIPRDADFDLETLMTTYTAHQANDSRACMFSIWSSNLIAEPPSILLSAATSQSTPVSVNGLVRKERASTTQSATAG